MLEVLHAVSQEAGRGLVQVRELARRQRRDEPLHLRRGQRVREDAVRVTKQILAHVAVRRAVELLAGRLGGGGEGGSGGGDTLQTSASSSTR